MRPRGRGPSLGRGPRPEGREPLAQTRNPDPETPVDARATHTSPRTWSSVIHQEQLVQWRARALREQLVQYAAYLSGTASPNASTGTSADSSTHQTRRPLPSRPSSRMCVQHKVALTHPLAHRVETRPLPKIHVDDIRRPAPVSLNILEVVTSLVQPRSARHSKRMRSDVFTRQFQRNCSEPQIVLHLNATKHAAVRHGEHRIDDQSRHKPSSTPMRATSSTRARF